MKCDWGGEEFTCVSVWQLRVLTKFVGHKGPNAVPPYLWCHIHRDELKKPFEERQLKVHAPKSSNLQLQEWESNPNWPKEHTPGDMVNDLAANRASQRNNGDMGENSYGLTLSCPYQKWIKMELHLQKAKNKNSKMKFRKIKKWPRCCVLFDINLGFRSIVIVENVTLWVVISHDRP